jgi:hypothetical protein
MYVLRDAHGNRACTIEFEARAFQGPHDPEPVLMHYKGVSHVLHSADMTEGSYSTVNTV